MRHRHPANGNCVSNNPKPTTSGQNRAWPNCVSKSPKATLRITMIMKRLETANFNSASRTWDFAGLPTMLVARPRPRATRLGSGAIGLPSSGHSVDSKVLSKRCGPTMAHAAATIQGWPSCSAFACRKSSDGSVPGMQRAPQRQQGQSGGDHKREPSIH